MYMRKIVAGVIVLLLIVYVGISTTVVKEGQEAQLTGEVAFNPTEEATKFWENQAHDYFSQNAVDLNTLITEADGNYAKLAQKYGHYSMGDKGELSFIVKGTGTVDVVKNKLRSGYFTVKLDGYTGDNIQFRIQIGPVFKGSAVRDSISLLNYNDYKNQIEWAQVSKAFHELISKEILAPIDMDTISGKQVEFIGCFTFQRASQFNITPVILSVK